MEDTKPEREELLANRRVGLLGGSFDPPHIGHLLTALDALESGKLSRVYFVPAWRSPLKGAEMAAGSKDRSEMVRLAVERFPGLDMLDWELERGGTSYTVDTVKRFVSCFPEVDLYWILGADQFAQLDKWRSIEELGRMAGFLVMAREGKGSGCVVERFPDVRLHFLPERRIDVSSTEIRKRCAGGFSLEPFVPAAVAAYIRTRRLYGWPAP